MLNRPRLIPCLTIDNLDLVKTVQFHNPRYLGDPINAVKIFNSKQVDELCILDITATKQHKGPNFDMLHQIATQAFMPLSYGGGISSIREITQLIHMGFEKVIINSSFIDNPDLVKEASRILGSQSVVVSLDVKRDGKGKPWCYSRGGTKNSQMTAVDLARSAQEYGAGEILINSIDHDGMMDGYDIPLIKSIVDVVSVPVIACGGAKDIEDFKKALFQAGAHAVAAGSFFVFFGPKKAVLINAPIEEDLFRVGIYR